MARHGRSYVARQLHRASAALSSKSFDVSVSDSAPAADSVARSIVAARSVTDSAAYVSDVVTNAPVWVIRLPLLPCFTGGGGGGTPTPPTIVYVTPPPIYRFSPVTIRVVSPALERFLIVASYPGSPGRDWDLVHDGTQFDAAFSGPRNVIAVVASPQAVEITALRDGGWPSPPVFDTVAVDTSGQEA